MSYGKKARPSLSLLYIIPAAQKEQRFRVSNELRNRKKRGGAV